jgi:hypothetical protein
MLIELHSITERERGVKVIDFEMVKPEEKKKGLFANLTEEIARRLKKPADEARPSQACIR